MTITKTIDLHGYTHNEAEEMLEQFLLKESQENSLDIKVICGQSRLMRNRVIEVCKRWDFGFMVPANNLGEVNIQYNKL